MNIEQVINFVDAAVYANTNKHLKDVEVLILQGSWQGQKYYEIAEANDYSAKYIQQDKGPKLWKLLSEALGEEVSKTNFRAAVERKWRSHDKAVPQFQEPIPSDSEPEVEEKTAPDFVGRKEVIADKRGDWKEAVDVLVFYGRAEELNELQQWVVDNRCRLETLLGMGGIGKTALYVKLTEQIQDEFEYFIWRLLRNAPTV